MRIAVFTDSYRPYTSGVVRSIETCRHELEARGHQVFIFAPRYNWGRYGEERAGEKRVFRFCAFPTPNKTGFSLAIPLSIHLRQDLRRLGVDLVHVHSPFLLGRLGARAARDLGLPLVFTHHTLYDQYVHYFPVARKLTRQVTQRLAVGFCNRCDVVLVPTRVIGDYIRELGVTSPIKDLPTGIRIEDFSGGDRKWLRQRFGIADDEKVLLFVGRMGLEKNVDFLLRAFQLVRASHPGLPLRLVLVGGGPEMDNFQRLAATLGIAEHTLFAGPVAPEKMGDCYAGADLFVFASVTETQGLVIGEAKAAGLPAVAVRAFGVSEMVTDGEDGFLTPEDEAAFAEKVGRLVTEDELYRRFAAAARANAARLSAQALTDRLLGIYRALLDERALSPQGRGRKSS
ncbi:MAG: glycosyltransferase [Bacillota bacterium]|nr:glycosyltransferase [Bacillota bacterium]